MIETLQIINGRTPNEECIKILEDMLNLARSGDAQSVFVVADCRGNISSSWAVSGHCSKFELLGGIENAKLRYVHREIAL